MYTSGLGKYFSPWRAELCFTVLINHKCGRGLCIQLGLHARYELSAVQYALHYILWEPSPASQSGRYGAKQNAVTTCVINMFGAIQQVRYWWENYLCHKLNKLEAQAQKIPSLRLAEEEWQILNSFSLQSWILLSQYSTCCLYARILQLMYCT